MFYLKETTALALHIDITHLAADPMSVVCIDLVINMYMTCSIEIDLP